MASFDLYWRELQAQLQEASMLGEKDILIDSTELETAFGVAHISKKSCFAAMESELGWNDLTLVERSVEQGMIVQYVLPRPVRH